MKPEQNFLEINMESDSALPLLGNMDVENLVMKFDNQFLQIFTRLKELHKLKSQSKEFSLDCFVESFENEVTENDKSVLLKEIEIIGFDKLRDTFENINLECEDYLCDPENIFGILKRHHFNKKTPKNDSDKLKQIIQFMHLTLIHINILHKNMHKALPEKLISIKSSAFNTIEPFVKKVNEIFDDILFRHRKLT